MDVPGIIRSLTQTSLQVSQIRVETFARQTPKNALITAYDYLTRIGCDCAQGYFISPPVPPGELSRILGRSLDLNRCAAS